MKNKILLGILAGIFIATPAIAGHIYPNAHTIIDPARNVTKTVYSCKFDNVSCHVYKVKQMYNGRRFYDSECYGNNFENGRFTKRAISDVKIGKFQNCRMVSKEY